MLTRFRVRRSLLFCTVLLAAAAQAQSSRAPIARLRQAWVAALEARSLEGSLALYATDATFINPDGTHADTPAQLRTLYASVFAHFTSRIDLTSRRTGQSGDLAFDSGSFTEVLHESGKPAGQGTHHFSGDYLTLYQRGRDGRWRILQQAWTQKRPRSPTE